MILIKYFNRKPYKISRDSFFNKLYDENPSLEEMLLLSWTPYIINVSFIHDEDYETTKFVVDFENGTHIYINDCYDNISILFS